jgi:hypothetical protein
MRRMTLSDMLQLMGKQSRQRPFPFKFGQEAAGDQDKTAGQGQGIGARLVHYDKAARFTGREKAFANLLKIGLQGIVGIEAAEELTGRREEPLAGPVGALIGGNYVRRLPGEHNLAAGGHPRPTASGQEQH